MCSQVKTQAMVGPREVRARQSGGRGPERSQGRLWDGDNQEEGRIHLRLFKITLLGYI